MIAHIDSGFKKLWQVQFHPEIGIIIIIIIIIIIVLIKIDMP